MQHGLIACDSTVGIDYQTFLDEIKHHSLFNGNRLIAFLEDNLLQIEIIDALDFFQAAIRTLYDFKLPILVINIK